MTQAQSPGVHLDRSVSGSFHYYYTAKTGDSWYGMAKRAGVDLQKLRTYNPKIKNLSSGNIVKIPVQNHDIYTDQNIFDSARSMFIPVYYMVKAKDNLFQISRRYFYQNTGELMRKNGLKTININMNDQLLVGWLPIDQVLMPSMNYTYGSSAWANNPAERVHNAIQSSDQEVDQFSGFVYDTTAVAKPPIQYTTSSGIGFCDQNLPDGEQFFVLHNDARTNSRITLRNKMANREIHATVVDKIPEGIYPSDINVLISPGMAEKLGVRDQRFRIEMEYEKPQSR